MEAAAWTTLAIFIATVAVGVGKLAARVDHLEEWRGEVRDDIKAIRASQDEMRDILRNGAGRRH